MGLIKREYCKACALTDAVIQDKTKNNPLSLLKNCLNSNCDQVMLLTRHIYCYYRTKIHISVPLSHRC